MNFNEVNREIERMLKFGIKPGLERISKLLESLNNPQNNFKTIHIAGTNGKGSTAAMSASILKESEYLTGLYTSPHLVRINERFSINGTEISDEDFALVGERVIKAAKKLISEGFEEITQFEILTAMAFEYFSYMKVDFAVIEVGLGGRYDATNVITPELCFITSITFDHTEILGNSIKEIAYEKAGIIKKNVPVVVYPQKFLEAEAVIESEAAKLGVFSIFTSSESGREVSWASNYQVFNFRSVNFELENLKLALLGEHQIINAANVINGMLILAEKYKDIDEKAIRNGLRNVIWPCRLSVIGNNPIILADGAHNKEGLKSLSDAVIKYFPDYKKVLLIGMLKDKEYEFAVKYLGPLFDSIITTEIEGERKLEALELASLFIREFENKTVYNESDWLKAVKKSIQIAEELKNNNEKNNETNKVLICISGSLYLTGYLLEIAKKQIRNCIK